jgi:hypothetical protein
MDLKEKLNLNSLYDIYGELLTEKQKVYFEYYYLQDYSLAEISEILKVSRNAVHIQLKNVINHLENYESKLLVLKNKEDIKKIIKKINNQELSLEEITKELEKV